VDLLEKGENEVAEDFADAFAGALLFPEAAAAAAYDRYCRKKTEPAKVREIMEIAKDYVISPFSVYKEMEKLVAARKLEFCPVDEKLLHAEISAFNKRFKTISQILFDGCIPSADHFMRVGNEKFNTPVFKVLGDYVRETQVSDSTISRMLDIPLVDAREMRKALV